MPFELIRVGLIVRSPFLALRFSIPWAYRHAFNPSKAIRVVCICTELNGGVDVNVRVRLSCAHLSEWPEQSSLSTLPGRVLPGRHFSRPSWSGKELGVSYKLKFIFATWLSIFISFKRMQTCVLLFHSRIMKICVHTKSTASLVNSAALQSSWSIWVGGGGESGCCRERLLACGRPSSEHAPHERNECPLDHVFSASTVAASHPITRVAQSRRLTEDPSFQIALILVKWQSPL